MKNLFSTLTSLFLILALLYFSFARLLPDANYTTSGFSMDRAFSHVEQIGQNPHAVGTTKHAFVRNYIVQQLQKMGLEVQTQEGYCLSDDGILVKPINILSRIPGTNPDAKALVLMSHYDSNPHSAKGASDAGSGVATILESIRAFLSNQTSHENDIIILFTDAEELGLNGAKLFVNEHDWANDVGLVLNFEARGSGGPSNMIVETNGGNSGLIASFNQANVEFPVATSLMYSVYKLLPNDTDSTIFREDKNINSFFFAFIDDHYDYHTALDSPQRLDKTSLAHQASYLMPLLKHFSNTNLDNLHAENDDVYFDLPFSTLVHYPFAWVTPMLILAILLFIGLLLYGFKKRRLKSKELFLGFIPFLVVLIGAPLISFLGWKALLAIYPQYQEILQGFTYNGHFYIAAFVCLTLGVIWFVYGRLAKTLTTVNLLIAPITIWLIVCIAIAFGLKGASFFIIPVFLGLLSFWLCIRQRKPMPLLLALINGLSIIILAPLVQFFPVGLGLKMLMVSSLFTVLLFGLLLPVFGFYKRKFIFGSVFLLLSVVFFIKAHLNAQFSEEQPKPNSLVYSFNQDDLKAHWYTYDSILDDWTKSVLGDDPIEYKPEVTFKSKYNTGYTFSKIAPPVSVPEPSIEIIRNDSSSAATTTYHFKIAPNRRLNRMELYTKDTISFKSFSANNLTVGNSDKENEGSHKYKKRYSNHVLTYYVTDMDTLRLSIELDKNHKPEFVLYEASNDLLTNPEVPLQQRNNTMIPKPFVLNDAIISKKTINLNTWDFTPIPKPINVYE